MSQTSLSAYRELTTDDYLRAAQIVASCRRGYLPMVIEIIRKAGIDVQLPTPTQSPDEPYILDHKSTYVNLRNWILSSPETVLYDEKGRLFCHINGSLAYIPRKAFDQYLNELDWPIMPFLQYLRANALIDNRGYKGFTRRKRFNGDLVDCIFLRL